MIASALCIARLGTAAGVNRQALIPYT